MILRGKKLDGVQNTCVLKTGDTLFCFFTIPHEICQPADANVPLPFCLTISCRTRIIYTAVLSEC